MISSPNSIYKSTYQLIFNSTLFVALAHCDVTIFGPFPTPLYNQLECNSSFRSVKIHHFGSISFCVGDEVSNLPIAVCSWYLLHRQFSKYVTIFGPFPTPLYNQLECNSSFRSVKIHHFGSISFCVGDEVSNLPIAVCSWYLLHRQFSKPVQIWCADKFEHLNNLNKLLLFCFYSLNKAALFIFKDLHQ